MEPSNQILVFCFFGFAIALMILMAFVVRRIRLENPDLWRQLGSPALFKTGDFSTGVGFWTWLFSVRQSRSLADGTRTLVWILRVATILYLCGFAYMVVQSIAPG